VWGTSQLTREASFSAKALNNIWKGLIRPHLEYGAEVMDTSPRGSWTEAERIMTKMGRKILRCGPTTTNEAVRGELGWKRMLERRIVKRLTYWGKIMKMGPERWVKKMYLAGRREYRTNPRVNNWYSVTKSWMAEVGLREYWEREDAGFEDHEGEEEEPARAGGPGWKGIVRKVVHEYAEGEWLKAMEDKVKLVDYRKWKKKLRFENYLKSPDVIGRTTLFQIRCGTNHLRVDTGRNEKVVEDGRRRPMKRHERICRQCELETEDVHHVLLYCPCYCPIRWAFLLPFIERASGDMAHKTFLMGLCDKRSILKDYEEAEKLLALTMSKDEILRTMTYSKEIMRQRARLIREHERARLAYAEDLRGRPDEINMPMEEDMDPLEELMLEDPYFMLE